MAEMPTGWRRYVGVGIGRSTWLLTACQTFYFMGITVDLTLTGIVGLSLAPTPALATLPLAAITIAGSLCAFFAGFLTQRIGYVPVMVLGALVAITGSGLSVMAVVTGSFPLLCCGTAMVGVYRATGGYIRYMAADQAPPGQRERALSFILYGGLAAAFVGPFVATTTSNLFGAQYAGAYLMVGLYAMLNIPLLLAVRANGVKATNQPEKLTPVPLSDVRGTRRFITGLVALLCAGSMMTMIMAVGPIGNQHAGHSASAGAVIIQWHLVGMFAPSIVSGVILARIGPVRTAQIGAVLFLAAALCGVSGTWFVNFLLALTFNGIAWNFLYLAGTTLLVRCYPRGRGGRVQAMAEGVGSVTGVTSSLSASTVFYLLGWQGTNVPVLTISVVLLVVMTLAARRPADEFAAVAEEEPAPRPAQQTVEADH
ncbi:MFS transporter [Actinophytocola oryzae]|uniref:Putative MFS family arabinose efflux permease n=1 Tax=Actinophytocola oryzae TaxID=502181 RepID=A0A4V3FT29_9PSEU|nr:MFS transporter [Actinophytocola oryzae]TDV49761.1 putative MFS family arabinose efflux permease [Actinophytocola oryzae]